MKRNTGVVFRAVVFVSAASFGLCAALLTVSLGAASRSLGFVLPADLAGLAREVAWSNLVGGLVGFPLLMARVGLDIRLDRRPASGSMRPAVQDPEKHSSRASTADGSESRRQAS